ncbi:mrr restriction system protein [Calothrix sp. NIES-4101]|nr:mrr restriction system protein [Calothrix sp. NIES-4101]
MALPDYQEIMLPLLGFVADGGEHSSRESVERMAEYFTLTEQERRELLPSGRQYTFDNRVGWARTYLKKAGLLESTRRGYFRITQRGQEVLKQNPTRIDARFLEKFPEFIDFRNSKPESGTVGVDENATNSQTPEELIEAAIQQLNQELAIEILDAIKACSPAFFEKLVVELLLKMGYGGTRKDAGQTVGQSGDGGVDGIINEDRLGLDVIYIQAKRWDNSVSRPEVQKFAGSLQGLRARKGIFITTSSFTREAKDFVEKIDSRIILIDGDRLTKLMIENNVGVTALAAYEIKKIDSDFFSDT